MCYPITHLPCIQVGRQRFAADNVRSMPSLGLFPARKIKNMWQHRSPSPTVCPLHVTAVHVDAGRLPRLAQLCNNQGRPPRREKCERKEQLLRASIPLSDSSMSRPPKCRRYTRVGARALNEIDDQTVSASFRNYVSTSPVTTRAQHLQYSMCCWFVEGSMSGQR